MNQTWWHGMLAGLVLILSGCAGSGSAGEAAFQGSGTDRLPVSPCSACDKEPFYTSGKWM